MLITIFYGLLIYRFIMFLGFVLAVYAMTIFSLVRKESDFNCRINSRIAQLSSIAKCTLHGVTIRIMLTQICIAVYSLLALVTFVGTLVEIFKLKRGYPFLAVFGNKNGLFHLFFFFQKKKRKKRSFCHEISAIHAPNWHQYPSSPWIAGGWSTVSWVFF